MAQQSWKDVEYLYYWPESERLKTAINTSRFETIYTMPGIVSDEQLIDKMAYTVTQITGVPMNRPTVPTNVEGLKQLIGLGHLRSAYNLTSTLLTAYGQGVGTAGKQTRVSFEIFEVWSCRFQLMMALKMHSQLTEEISAFGSLDAPDTYFQYYPDLKQQGYSGSLVPFNMRLIHAEVGRFSPDPIQSVKACCDLELKTRFIIEHLKSENRPENQIKTWQARLESVLMAKARAWFSMKEFHQCIVIYSGLLQHISEDKKAKIIQLLLRTAVLIGDEKLVERYARDLTIQNSGSQNYYLHKGIKAGFYGNYSKAVEHFQAAQKGTGGLTNPMVTNNEAIAQLYNGKVEDARKNLLAFPAMPNEPIMHNVNTVSQLAATSADTKKREMFAKYCEQLPDIFDPQALKMLT